MKRGALLGIVGLSGLGILTAGYLWYNILKPGEPVSHLNHNSVPQDTTTEVYTGRSNSIDYSSHRLPVRPSPSARPTPYANLSALVRRLISASAAVPSASALGYEGSVEQFSVSDDVPPTDLNDLFQQDCVGRCLYVRGADGNVTKLRLRSDSPLELYDESMGDCLKLTDPNSWVYMDAEGQVNGYGLGQESLEMYLSGASEWNCKK